VFPQCFKVYFPNCPPLSIFFLNSQMVLLGLSPAQILSQVYRRASQVSYSLAGGEDAAEDSPYVGINYATIKNIRKRLLARIRVDPNDVIATDEIIKALGGSILYHVPQEMQNETVSQHLQLAICTEFQRRMLKSFGSKLIFRQQQQNPRLAA
jgi:hypothetical protein